MNRRELMAKARLVATPEEQRAEMAAAESEIRAACGKNEALAEALVGRAKVRLQERGSPWPEDLATTSRRKHQ